MREIKKIGVITFAKKHGRDIKTIGSSIWRGEWLANNWPEASLWTEGLKTDALIFQKVYWIEMLESFDGVKILDLCDPDWMTGELEIVKVSKLVDAITCSSRGIYDYLSKFIKWTPLYYVPDRIDLRLFSAQKKHIGRAKRVVWFGYQHNAKAILPFVLNNLAAEKLELMILSNNEIDFGSAIPSNFSIIQKKFSWETLIWDMQTADICVNPQPEQYKKFKFKSNNKTLIAWACGLPVANDADELKTFLEPKSRIAEIEKRNIELKEKWDIKYSIKEFKNIILECAKKK